MVRSPLPSDIAQTLVSLEKLIAKPKVPEANAAIRAHIAALSSWGEVLGIEAFVSLSRTTLTLLRLNPEHGAVVVKLALEGYDAAYQLALQMRQSPNAAMAAPVPDLNQPDINGILKTTNLFIWQMSGLVLTLPSADVAEILIPEVGQIIMTENQWGLQWRQQTLPIYTLAQRGDGDPPAIILKEIVGRQLGDNTSTTLLVITHKGHNVALEVAIEALVTAPDLAILPFPENSQCPQYCYGLVQPAEGTPTPLINVATLVEEILGQQPDLVEPLLSLEQPSTPPPIEPTAPMVMVIDDSTTLRKILSMKLKEAGYQVVQAQDGQDALAQLQVHRTVKLAVCDIDMPNMNGFEFLSHCRRDPIFAALPVVMLSTYNERHHRQLAKTLGANAYFGKPYQETEFLNTLKSIVT